MFLKIASACLMHIKYGIDHIRLFLFLKVFPSLENYVSRNESNELNNVTCTEIMQEAVNWRVLTSRVRRNINNIKETGKLCLYLNIIGVNCSSVPITQLKRLISLNKNVKWIHCEMPKFVLF